MPSILLQRPVIQGRLVVRQNGELEISAFDLTLQSLPLWICSSVLVPTEPSLSHPTDAPPPSDTFVGRLFSVKREVSCHHFSPFQQPLRFAGRESELEAPCL